MAKPIDEFGGWLRFFQIVLWFNILMSLYSLYIQLSGILEVISNYKMFILQGMLTLDILIGLLIVFLMVRKIVVKSPETPITLIRLLFWNMMIKIGFFLLEIPLVLWLFEGKWPMWAGNLIRGTVSAIIGYFIWSFFIKNIKRTVAFYGIDEKILKGKK